MSGGYAIRFDPVDGDEVARATAAYLSDDYIDGTWNGDLAPLTTVSFDVHFIRDRRVADNMTRYPTIRDRATHDKCVATVVTYAEAVADLEQT